MFNLKKTKSSVKKRLEVDKLEGGEHDHGRSKELGYVANWKKYDVFKICQFLKCFSK